MLLAHTKSGIQLTANVAEFPFDAVDFVADRTGVTVQRGDSHAVTVYDKRPEICFVKITHRSPGYVWVPDYLFGTMVIKHHWVIPRQKLFIEWPEKSATRDPKQKPTITREITKEYAREFLFELICEGDSQRYQDLIANSGEVIQCLKMLK